MSAFPHDLVLELSKFREKMKENYRIVKDLVYTHADLWDYYPSLNLVFENFPQLFEGEKCLYLGNGGVVKDSLKERDDYPDELIFDLCKVLIKEVEISERYLNELFVEHESNIRIIRIDKKLKFVKISETYSYKL